MYIIDMFEVNNLKWLVSIDLRVYSWVFYAVIFLCIVEFCDDFPNSLVAIHILNHYKIFR